MKLTRSLVCDKTTRFPGLGYARMIHGDIQASKASKLFKEKHNLHLI
jgi:hypothetical protein